MRGRYRVRLARSISAVGIGLLSALLAGGGVGILASMLRDLSFSPLPLSDILALSWLTTLRLPRPFGRLPGCLVPTISEIPCYRGRLRTESWHPRRWCARRTARKGMVRTAILVRSACCRSPDHT